MTDISKYKNVSLSKDTYSKIDKIRRVIVPNTIISRSQTINILVNKEEKRLNGKVEKQMFTISQEQKKELLKYLAKRPYIEVAGLVAMIASLEPVKKEKGKQDNGKDKAQ